MGQVLGWIKGAQCPLAGSALPSLGPSLETVHKYCHKEAGEHLFQALDTVNPSKASQPSAKLLFWVHGASVLLWEVGMLALRSPWLAGQFSFPSLHHAALAGGTR